MFEGGVLTHFPIESETFFIGGQKACGFGVKIDVFRVKSSFSWQQVNFSSESQVFIFFNYRLVI